MIRRVADVDLCTLTSSQFSAFDCRTTDILYGEFRALAADCNRTAAVNPVLRYTIYGYFRTIRQGQLTGVIDALR